jgi:hypothetical protein
MSIIHKKIVSSVRCTSFQYQLCDHSNNDKDKSKMSWVGNTSFLWRNVTCPQCLKLKEVKRDKVRRSKSWE